MLNNITSRYTPINDSDTACDITWSSLCIYNIDPNIITDKLGIVPTSKYKKGEGRLLPTGEIITNVENSWILSSEKNISSKDIRTHLDWLLNNILDLNIKIKELQKIPNIKMSIRCVWFSAEGGGGPTLWPEQMERMADLNLECNFSFAYYG